jgi:hypothetical protein
MTIGPSRSVGVLEIGERGLDDFSFMPEDRRSPPDVVVDERGNVLRGYQATID